MSTTIGSSLDLSLLCHALAHLSPFATVVFEDLDQTLVYANPAFCDLAGEPVSSLLGRPVAASLPKCSGCIDLLRRVGASGQPEQRTEDGDSEAWSYAAWPVFSGPLPRMTMVQITATSELHRRAALMNEALLVSAVQQHEVVENVTASAELMSSAIVQKDKELDRTHEELRSLALQLLQAQEDERRRIARELHDGFAQQLASLGMQVFQLQKQIPDSTGNSLAAKIQAQLGELSTEVRAMSHQLHPPSLEDLGLGVSLRGLVEDFEGTHSIPIRLIVPDFAVPVPIAVATALYRIAQESLWNVVKHAGKDALVTIQLLEEPACVTLRIDDTGVGFDASETRGKGGLGLISMYERARSVSGSATVKAHPGGGTTVCVRVPWPLVPQAS